jgi:hypothetical protein
MTVFRKLQAARLELVNSGIKKTGYNSYGKWHYYELGDFIPTVHRLFDAVGLCGIFNIDNVTATLTIFDNEDGTHVTFSSPVVMATNGKGQDIQSLGATHTYMRRYLWLMAMEIVEADAVDSQPQEEKKPEPKVSKPKEEAPKKPEVPAKIAGKPGEFQITVQAEDTCETLEWIELVRDAAHLLLDFCKSKEDVLTIFQKNKAIFERVKTIDPEFFKEMMGKFTEVNNKFGA